MRSRSRQRSGVGGELVRRLQPGDHVAMVCETSHHSPRVGGLGEDQLHTRQRGEALAGLARVQGELTDPCIVQKKQTFGRIFLTTKLRNVAVGCQLLLKLYDTYVYTFCSHANWGHGFFP